MPAACWLRRRGGGQNRASDLLATRSRAWYVGFGTFDSFPRYIWLVKFIHSTVV